MSSSPDPTTVTLPAVVPELDLNGLSVSIQGHNAADQAKALQAAFPAANVQTGQPVLQQPLLRRRTRTEIAIYIFSALALMVVGHLLLSYFTLDRLTLIAGAIDLTPDIFYFILAGFVAQMIDGALGMAYGVTATTFLTSVGISPVFATASVHSSEIFTSGVSGYMHLKFGNVNSRLFKVVLIPGVIGAALGAFLLVKLADLEVVANYLTPAISVYTAILGILILKKSPCQTNKEKAGSANRPAGLVRWFCRCHWRGRLGAYRELDPHCGRTAPALHHWLGQPGRVFCVVCLIGGICPLRWIGQLWHGDHRSDSGRYDCGPDCGPFIAQTTRQNDDDFSRNRSDFGKFAENY